MKSILLSNKHFLISALLMISAIIFVVINQVDYLSKFSTAIVALALLVPSIIFAGLGIYRPGRAPFRWASMTTLVITSVLLIFVASNLYTSLTEEDALEENGIAKEADVLAPDEVEAEGQEDQEADLETYPVGHHPGIDTGVIGCGTVDGEMLEHQHGQHKGDSDTQDRDCV